MLPKPERLKVEASGKKRIWIYGATMIGKTQMADQSPNPLMLNTDGNTKFVTAPRILVKDTIKKTGRMINKTTGWENFKEIIDELEVTQGDNGYDTIVIDLVEDYYEMARIYSREQMGISHESDNSFKAWDVVTNEFLNTFRRLLNLDYNMILISHEDLSRDILKASGDNITQIKPNLREKVANKLAGMVDIVGRAVQDDKDGQRYLEFKTDAVTFGGTRLPITVDRVPLKWEEIEKLYKKGASK